MYQPIQSRRQVSEFYRRYRLRGTLNRLARIRDREAWEILSSSSFIKFFSATQRAWLEAMLSPVEIQNPGTLINEGDPISNPSIIRKVPLS